VPRNGNNGSGAPAACGGAQCRAPGADAVVHRAGGATPRSSAMRRRPRVRAAQGHRRCCRG